MMPISRLTIGFGILSLALGAAGCAGGASPFAMALLVIGGLLGLAGCAESTEDPCCVNGKVTVCECPPNAACNYAPFKDNGDGTCSLTLGPGMQADGPPDAGFYISRPDAPAGSPPDGGAEARVTTWDPADAAADAMGSACCLQGRLATCHCPPTTVCNYAPFRACPDGTCYLVMSGSPEDGHNLCPADAGRP